MGFKSPLAHVKKAPDESPGPSAFPFRDAGRWDGL